MATTKKLKVLDVSFNRKYDGPKGTSYYFNMKVDDNGTEMTGQFSTNKEVQNKFEVGKEYLMTIEVKQNNRGEYNFFNKAKDDTNPAPSSGGGYKGSSGGGWVRPRNEVISIIAQSSYEAAATLCVKITDNTPENESKIKINSHTQIASISKQFTSFIVHQSGLNSDECKNGIKDALKAANEKSIVYQKALKLAVICLDLPHMEATLEGSIKFHSTNGMISVTDMIYKDIVTIAESL